MDGTGEAEFRDVLHAHLLDLARTHETAVEEPVPGSPESDVADIVLPTPPGVVVAVVPDDVAPRERAVVERARDRATERDAACFATCNSNDLFLFHRRDDADCYYVDLRDGRLEGTLSAFLDAVRHVHEHGDLPAQSTRERVGGVLRSAHSAVRPAYEALAREAYGRDEPFTRAFDEWARANDARDEAGQFETAATQYAYLRACEALLFGAGPEDPGARPGAAGPGRPFEADGDLFAAFPESERTGQLLDDVAATVDHEAVARLDGDLLGDVYEELIPAGERQALGQFYTPPAVAAAVCRWSIPDVEGERRPRVLDPAAGSGTFVVAAAEELAARGASHREIVDSVAAVDVNRFPLHLTALNLAGPRRTDRLRLSHDSFFDLAPADRLAGPRADAPGDPVRFDAVVGNPPYLRQEDLPDTAHFRDHLAAFGPSGATPYADGSKRLSERSDAYVYFATHATQFLRDGGRLGFVVPTKWLTTRYGESFQEFLYDHYRVEAVVGFSARAFGDALVDAALLLLERCDDERERRATTTRFVRVEDPVTADDLVETLSLDVATRDDAVAVRHRPASRTVAVDQDALMDAGGTKLSPYLRAPVEFIRLLDHPLFTALGDLGETHRGVMTGANDFFFLDEADRERWGLPDRFLTPAVKSIRDVEHRVVRAADSDRYLFDVHEYVAAVERETGDDRTPLEPRIRDALERDGYDETLRYVEWGESEAYHERRSCAARRVWFDLGDLDPPEILHPKFFDERVFVVWNPDRLMPSNAVDCVRLDPGVDEDATMGVLNSTVNKAMLECWGRAEGGGALQLLTYEVTSLPVLDVRELDEDARARIGRLNDRLVAGEERAQADLDRAVLDALGLELSVAELQALYEAMVQRRVGEGDGALVERGDRESDRRSVQ